MAGVETQELWASDVQVGDLIGGIPVTDIETTDGLFFWFKTDDGTWWGFSDDQKVEVEQRVDNARNK